jgi:hypothetical protein
MAPVTLLRRWSPVEQGLQDLLDAEIVDRRPEKDGRLPAGKKADQVERAARALDQVNILTQFPDLAGKLGVEDRIVEAVKPLGFATSLLPGSEMQQAVIQQVIDATKGLAHADRPGDRSALDAQHRFDLLKQVERLADLTVELVDEGDDRRVAHPADVEQLDGLRLDPLGRIDDHHRRIDGGQHAIGILGKILVARCVEKVDGVQLILELHDRAGHRNTALFFHLHPVRSGVPGTLAALYRAGELDRTAEKQELLGQGGLSRVRV